MRRLSALLASAGQECSTSTPSSFSVSLARAGRKWERVAGRRLAAASRPRSLRRGVLTVEVDSSALLAELGGFRRQELLRGLVAGPEPLGVREVKFVLAEGLK